MSRHQVASTTRSLELTQIEQINRHLTGDGGAPHAHALGLGDAGVNRDRIDEVAARKAHLPDHELSRPAPEQRVARDARLIQLVPAGSPTFPYIYGLFTLVPAGDRDTYGTGTPFLPVELHTAHLRMISSHYRLHHRWGI